MKPLLKLSAFILLIIIIALSCQKVLEDKNGLDNEFNSTIVKNWYYTTFDKTALQVDKSKPIKKLPDWKKGAYYKNGTMQIMEFPLLKDEKQAYIPAKSTLTEAEKRRLANSCLYKVVFKKDINGEIALKQLDYIPEWAYLKSKNFDISTISINDPANDFTGYIINRNWEGAILSVYIYKKGEKIKTGKITYSNQSKNTPKSNLEGDCPCMATCETCLCMCYYVQICTTYADGYEMCGEAELQYCNVILQEGCSEEGEEEGCDPNAIYPEEQEFNNYILSQTDAVSVDAPATIAGPDPISDQFSWSVTKGMMNNWEIKAITNYTYTKDRKYDINLGVFVDNYDLYFFNTGTAYLTNNSNTFITTTYTQPTPTHNQVLNNNTSFTVGKSHVIGKVNHVANVAIRIPFCNPLTLTHEEDVDNTMQFTPK